MVGSCDRCGKELDGNQFDVMFRDFGKPFGRGLPSLCSECDKKLNALIERFVNEKRAEARKDWPVPLRKTV